MKTKFFFLALLCLLSQQLSAQLQAISIEAVSEVFSIPPGSRLRVDFEKHDLVNSISAISFVVVNDPSHPANGTWSVVPTDGRYVQTAVPQAEGFWDFVASSHVIVHVFDFAFEFNAPLPVELLSFTAFVDGSHANLSWQVAEEFHFDRYLIEYSRDGLSFESIAEQVGTGSGGTYLFVDPNLTNGTHYYRLKMLDLDGSFQYSEIVVIEVSEHPDLEVYPTITTGRLYLRSDHPQSFVLYTMTEQVVQKGTFDSTIDISDLVPGYYCLRLNKSKPMIILLSR